MNLQFDSSIANHLTSQSQIARVLTETWVKENSFCPNCGSEALTQFDNNRAVADFICDVCTQEYELKSKNGVIGAKIVDGAYNSMISRINSDNNPNFFFLTYDKVKWSVKDFLIIPKHYFITDIIEKRKPLAITAKRAGWVGCNILLHKIPSTGRIFLIKDDKCIDKKAVRHEWQKTEFLKTVPQEAKGWLIEILNCLDLIPSQEFKLEDLYKFEPLLRSLYPNNNHIKDKIRQQLQILRDKGALQFLSRGTYKKI